MTVFNKHFLRTVGLLLIFTAFRSDSNFGQPVALRRDSLIRSRGISETNQFKEIHKSVYLNYDDQLRPTEWIIYKSEGGQWLPWRHHLVEFDPEEAQVSLRHIQQWQNATQTWVDYQRESMLYNENGELVSKEIAQAPSPGMPLENREMWFCAYNEEQNKISSTYFIWSGTDWVNKTRQLWKYNDQEKVTEQLNQQFSEAEWVNLSRRTWNYDPNNRLLANIDQQIWDQGSQEWINQTRRNYTSNSSARWTSFTIQNWNDSLLSWINEERVAFNYQPNSGQMNSRVKQLWDGENWVNHLRSSIQKEDTMVTGYVERDTSGSWWLAQRFRVVYDQMDLPLRSQGWQDWNDEQQVWVNNRNTSKLEHFWNSSITSNAPALQLANPCQIPNPYPLNQSFDCPDLEAGATYQIRLYSLTGQQVMEKTILGNSNLALEGSLPFGMYVMTWHHKNQLIHIRRLVITP